MPIYTYQCERCGMEEDHFAHSFKNALFSWDCKECPGVMHKIIAASAPALWFEEGRGRWIENITHQPVYVTSPAQLKDLEKKHGVTHATTDDLLYNKTRRALDARRESPHALKDAFRKAVENL